MNDKDIKVPDNNADPITGAPGSHPVGTGLGATGGGVAGAAIGAIAGPIGAAIGLVAGAVVGGLGGKAAAEGVNPTAEEAYWRDNYEAEPYYEAGRPYDEYHSAYQMGWTQRAAGADDFDAIEPDLERTWTAERGTSTLAWPDARPATRAAWDRADRTYYMNEVGDDSRVLDKDETVDVLNDLLENARDGEYGFRACAEEVESARMKPLFLDRAEQCRDAGVELTTWVRKYGGEPADGGTASGAMHRGWLKVKGGAGADSELSILEACERGEDSAIARYRKALKQNLPPEVRSFVAKQAEGAQRNHDKIRDLRNAARAADNA